MKKKLKITIIAFGLGALFGCCVYAATTFSDLTISGDKVGNVYTSNIACNYNVTNENGIKSIELKVAGKEVDKKLISPDLTDVNNPVFPKVKTGSFTLPDSFLSENEPIDNNYNLELIVTDANDNKDRKISTFLADVSIPKIDLTGIEENGFYNDSRKIKVTIVDSNIENKTMHINLKKDSNDIEDKDVTGGSYVSSVSDEGVYIFNVSYVDKGKRVINKTVNFTIDKTTPIIDEIDCNGHKKNGFNWYDDYVSIASSTSDSFSGLESAVVTVNDIEVKKYAAISVSSQSISINLDKVWFENNESSDGKYTVKIAAKDKSKNETVVTCDFYADVTIPEIYLNGVSEGAYKKDAVDIKATVKDNYAILNSNTIDIKRDSKPYDTKTITGSVNNYEKFYEDGEYEVTAKAIDKAGNESEKKTIHFTKDTVAPVLKVSGAKNNSYTRGSKKIAFNVVEKNYKNVTVSASIVKELDGAKTKIPVDISPTSTNFIKYITVNGTGTYTAKLTGTDKAGNVGKTATLVFTIDNEAPIVSINIKKIYGYDDSVNPLVAYKDSYLDSAKINVSRSSEKAVTGVSYNDSKNAKEGHRQYIDIKKNPNTDDIYTLTCTATDKAGNSTVKADSFIVDRFGSVYSLSKFTKKKNNSYHKRLSGDLTIIERNVAGLKDSNAIIIRDGEIINDNIVATTGEGTKGKTYRYNFPKELFDKEGVYSLNIKSLDLADNTSEYALSNDLYRLYIDRTKPTIAVSGITEGKAYKKAILNIKVNDSVKLKSYKVLAGDKIIYNSDLQKTLKENVEIELPNGTNMNIAIKARDMAGNKASHITKNITVSPNWFIRLISNKILIACVLFIILLGSLLIFYRRRHRSKEE